MLFTLDLCNHHYLSAIMLIFGAEMFDWNNYYFAITDI